MLKVAERDNSVKEFKKYINLIPELRLKQVPVHGYFFNADVEYSAGGKDVYLHHVEIILEYNSNFDSYAFNVEDLVPYYGYQTLNTNFLKMMFDSDDNSIDVTIPNGVITIHAPQ